MIRQITVSKSKVKIDYRPFWGLVLLFPFLAPSYIGIAYPTLNLVINFWQIVSLLFCLISLIRHGTINKQIFYVLFVFVPIMVSTFINGGDIETSIFQFAYVFGIVLATYYIISYYGIEVAFKAFMLLFEILIYSNVISMILYPRGLYHTSYLGTQLGGLETGSSLDRVGWLLGHQSLCSSYSIAAISIASIYSYMNSKGKKICFRSVFLIIASIIQSYLSGSAMNILSLVILGIMVILCRSKAIRKLLKNYWLIIVLCLFATGMIVYTNILQYFSSIIETVFGRSGDLSGRVQIWQYTMKLFEKKFVVGYGLEFEETSLLNIVNVTHAHNEYIQVLFSGGVIGFIGLMIFFGMYLNNSKQLMSKRSTCVPVLCCYGFMILMLTDVYFFRHPIVIVPFLLCKLFGEFIDGNKKLIIARSNN